MQSHEIQASHESFSTPDAASRNTQALLNTAADLFVGYDLPRRFTWHGKLYEIRQIGGHWRRRGKWWEGKGDRRFFRVITTRGVTLDLCQEESTGNWSVATVHD